MVQWSSHDAAIAGTSWWCGHEAHAGAHGEHVNAAHELTLKIAKMHKLTDYRKEVSVNVGHIQGGKDKFTGLWRSQCQN